MSERVVTLENDDVTVEVLAHEGGRIASLRTRRDQREWLSSPSGQPATAAVLGAAYTDTAHYGWDEMLPTVDPSVYVGDPYNELELADHGELWSAKWEVVNSSATSLRQVVKGQQLDYEFERTLTLAGHTLRVAYCCTVARPMTMLWALHPQFVTRPGTRLVLDRTDGYWLKGDDGALTEIPWPGDFVVERDLAAGSNQNYYLNPANPHVEPRLVDPDGATLTLEWDREFAPYLVIWSDHYDLTEHRVIAIEPMSGFYDDLGRAQRAGLVSEFVPQDPSRWWVDLTVKPGEAS
jgi:galactose mutarotase-like enzyme